MLAGLLTSLLVCAVAWRSRWRHAALLGALAVTAQAATLTLTDAPYYAVYQHLRLGAPLTPVRVLALAVLALQITVVIASSRRWGRSAVAALPVRAHPAAWCVFLLVFLFAAAVPATNASWSIGEAVASWALMAAMFGNVVLLVQTVPDEATASVRDWFRRTLGATGRDERPVTRWQRWLPYACALWVLVAGTLIALLVFDGVPHIDDSISYLFQAKYFAAGHLVLPAPPDSAAFHVGQLVVDRGHWFAYGFPGWPALLALGVAIGVPWLVNPIVSALCIVLAFELIRRTHDRGTANATALLMAASPWFLFMSGELLSHQAATLWLLLALLAVQIARQRDSTAAAAGAGLATGLLCLTRPFDGMLAGVVIALWMLGLLGAPRLRFRSLLAAAVAIGAVGLVGLAYNAAVTGNALHTAHRLWMDRAWGVGIDRLGFGPDRGRNTWPQLDPLPGHGPVDVVMNLNKNAFQLNVELFGWGFGSLVFAVAFLLSRGMASRDRFLIALAVAIPTGYSAYWFSGGPDFGARYWYLMLVPLVVFTVRGAQVASARLSSERRANLAPSLIVLATLVAMLTFVPWRATGKYFRYRGVTRAPARVAAAHGVRDALVFVQSRDPVDYQSAFNLNPPLLTAHQNVYARYLDEPSRARVVAGIPTRRVWVFTRDSSVRGAWSVVGPLPPGTVPR